MGRRARSGAKESSAEGSSARGSSARGSNAKRSGTKPAGAKAADAKPSDTGRRAGGPAENGKVSAPRSLGATVRDYAKAIGSALLIALLVRQFAFQAFRIPSGSMERTLLKGDFLFVNKFLFGAKTPKRVRIFGASLIPRLPHLTLPALRQPRQGDIIVFEWPEDPTQDYIKRCVAVAGDRLEVRDGILTVNGEIYESNFGDRDGDHSCVPGPGGGDGCPPPRSLREAGRRGAAMNSSLPTWEFGLREALAIAHNRSHLAYLREQFALVAAAALEAGLFPDPAAVREHVEALVGAVRRGEELSPTVRRRHERAVLSAVAAVQAPYIVPEGHIFMMGDNRFNSLDSRVWGALDTRLIRGKALFIYFSWDGVRKLPRFSRIGDIIR